MADRKNPFLEIGYGEYKGIHRMPFALKERAITHEENRERVVGSVLLELHIMAILNIIKREQLLKLQKARFQNLGGNKEDATEAAHCAPRQVMIDADSLSDVLQRAFPERALALSMLFAETDILPANFNKCDSRVERLGLNNAFQSACQYMLDAGRSVTYLDKNEIFIRAENGYAIYKNFATIAFLESIERLNDKLKPKFLFPKDKAKWTEQLQITAQYAATLKDSPGKKQAISIQKIEGLVKIYNMPLSEDY